MRTFSNSPEVFSTFDSSSIVGSNVLRASDDREWHSGREESSMLSRGLVVGVNGRLVDSDRLRFDDFTELWRMSQRMLLDV